MKVHSYNYKNIAKSQSEKLSPSQFATQYAELNHLQLIHNGIIEQPTHTNLCWTKKAYGVILPLMRGRSLSGVSGVLGCLMAAGGWD